MPIDLENYRPGDFFDEMLARPNRARPHAKALAQVLRSLGDDELAARQSAADLAIKAMGITFSVYSEGDGTIDRAWPFDILPRIIPAAEWERVERGLAQRVRALNMFIDDIYHEQRIVAEGVFPPEVLQGSKNFRAQCVGVSPPFGVWAHICGSDLVRDRDGTLYVLEDNLRVPSGVSYMLENRLVTKRVFPELFDRYAPLPVDNYPARLYGMLAELSPRRTNRPEIAVLTPGIYNSAYFEHAYPRPADGRANWSRAATWSSMTTTASTCARSPGCKRVDVIYRRIDDDFLDPEVFRRRFDARRAGPDARLAAGNVGAGERAGHRRRRRQGGVRLRAGDHPLLPRRGPDHPERADLPLHVRSDEREYVLDQSRQAGGQAGQRVGRLRHADRAARPRSAEREEFARS